MESLRSAKVKNKSAATVQITAEQILREAKERQEKAFEAPLQQIADEDELADYRQRRRKAFEDAIRGNRSSTQIWLRYGGWEEAQGELQRARSIFERALDEDSRAVSVWLRYGELEMKHKHVNHARNVLDRAVGLLPRVDQLWLKYAWMEELLGNVGGARQVFERWMEWQPATAAWLAYVKLERRYGEPARARAVFERFVGVHPQPSNWLKWARFEEELHHIDKARAIYEACIGTLGEDFISTDMYISFAKFETRQKEFDRSRAIYKYALDKFPKEKTLNLYKEYALFEKQHGEKDEIEDVVVQKRRRKYQEDVESNPLNYDTWIDYISLEESAGNFEKIRDVYEQAIAHVPPVKEKRLWRRYVYLWLFYATWEEAVSKDMDRAKQVYESALKIIPHKEFTFAKLWVQYAKFFIRRLDLTAARKTLGASIGMCPKEKIFKGYIEIELQLREFDRVRLLYEKYLGWNSANCYAWIKYAELEKMLGDYERARGIFDLAVQQNLLDMPEYLWKAYIDFEIGESEWERARDLYERLLERTEHVKVWISYANFELSNLGIGEALARVVKAREVFDRANNTLKGNDAKEERVLLLESWREFEREHCGDDKEKLDEVEKLMPKVVKKRRKLVDEITGEETNQWEEYYDYIFPDEEAQKPNFKLLAMAHKWKEMQEQQQDKEKDNDEYEG